MLLKMLSAMPGEPVLKRFIFGEWSGGIGSKKKPMSRDFGNLLKAKLFKMLQKSSQILKEINQLISSIEDSSIQKADKLKIIKVLLAVKLKLIELLGKELKAEARVMHLASVAKNEMAGNGSDRAKVSDKHELIIQFIKQNNGRVSAVQLLDIGIAGRSLRRYIRNLSASGKILVEKKGREHFYSVIV